MSRLLTLSMMVFIFAVPTSYSHIRIFHCLYAKTYSRHQYSIKKNSFNSKLKNGFLNSRIQRSCPRETTTTKQRSEVTLSLFFSCLCHMTQRYRISQSQKQCLQFSLLSFIDRYIWDVFTVDEIKTNNIYYSACIYTFFVEI